MEKRSSPPVCRLSVVVCPVERSYPRISRINTDWGEVVSDRINKIGRIVGGIIDVEIGRAWRRGRVRLFVVCRLSFVLLRGVIHGLHGFTRIGKRLETGLTGLTGLIGEKTRWPYRENRERESEIDVEIGRARRRSRVRAFVVCRLSFVP